MITYHVFKDAIVVHFNGKTFTIHKDDERHGPVLDAIKRQDFDSLPMLADNDAEEEIAQLLKTGVWKK